MITLPTSAPMNGSHECISRYLMTGEDDSQQTLFYNWNLWGRSPQSMRFCFSWFWSLSLSLSLSSLSCDHLMQKCILKVRTKTVNTKVFVKKSFLSISVALLELHFFQNVRHRKESLQEIKSGCAVPMRYVWRLMCTHIHKQFLMPFLYCESLDVT